VPNSHIWYRLRDVDSNHDWLIQRHQTRGERDNDRIFQARRRTNALYHGTSTAAPHRSSHQGETEFGANSS
jgi:hypothetical protein